MKTSSIIFQKFFRLFQRLPLGFHYVWGRLLSWFAEHCIKYRRDVIMVNLSRSFPEKKWKEIKSLCKDFYKHFGNIIAETIWYGGCKGNKKRLLDSGLFTMGNLEVLQDAFHNGNSVMVLTSHLGNWELMGSFPAVSGLDDNDFVVVYKKLKNDFWNDFIEVNRCALLTDFQGYIESKKVLRYAVTNRREHKIYVFPTDQFPYKGAARYEIPQFMNQKTQVMVGAVELAAKLKMSVLYYSMNRTGRGHYELNFTKICDDASSMPAAAVLQEFYALLEKDIQRDPANYLWSHNRWK